MYRLFLGIEFNIRWIKVLNGYIYTVYRLSEILFMLVKLWVMPTQLELGTSSV